jgi:hypothetical protein
MPIDTSILSGLKPLQIESPMNQLGKMYELQNAQQANQLGALKMQEAQRSMGANEQLRQLYGEQGVNQDSPEFLRRLGAISPEARRAQMKFMQEQALSQSTIARNTAQAASAGLTGQKAQLDRAKTLTDMGVSILGGATDEDSYQRSLAQLKIIGGDTSQLPTSYDKTRVQEFINKGLSHKDQLAAQDRALDEQIAKQFTLNATPPLVSFDSSLPPRMQTGILPSPGAPASMDIAGMARAKLAARPGDPQALALLQATQPKYSYQNLQNKIVPVQTNALAPGFAPPQPMAMGMSPSAAEQLKVSQGQLGVSQGQLDLGRDRLAYEKANPNKTIHEDPNGYVAIDNRTGVATPVVYGPMTGFAAPPSGAGISGQRAAPANITGQPAQGAPTAMPLPAEGGARVPGAPVSGKEKLAPENFTKTDMQLSGLVGSIKQFKDEIKLNPSTSAKWLPTGSDTARMNAKYISLLMGIKDLYTLGALTGPDLGLIEAQISNPASWSGKFTSKAGFEEQVKVIEDMVKRSATNLENSYGRPPKATKKAIEASTGSASSPEDRAAALRLYGLTP